MSWLKGFLISLFLVAVPVVGFAELSESEIKQKMIQDLDVIKQAFEVKYAPREWKGSYNGWDLEREIKTAQKKILSKRTIKLKDYQRIVRDFFHSTTDYHVGVHFYSTEMAALPFRMHSVNGKYYVAWGHPDLCSLNKGDEVLLFNGRPIHQVVEEFKLSEFGNPKSKTDQALAEATFTFRTGSKGNLIPQGEVVLTVRHAGTNEVNEEELAWFYAPEEITSAWIDHPIKKEIPARKGLLGQHAFFYKDMSAPFFKTYLKDKKMMKKAFSMGTDDDTFIGSKKGFLPDLGNVIWKAPSDFPFRAYIYEGVDGKKVGYVRIPHYMGDIYEIDRFVELISQFEAKTDVLVIDQLSNPGGSVFYMYGLASILADKPLVVPKQRFMLTQQDLYFAWEYIEELEGIETDDEAVQFLGPDIGGFPVNLEVAHKLLNYFHFVMSEWEQGRTFTETDYLFGIDTLSPHHKVHYSKPILFLVNSLDFSCGDFMPAIMQDNKRATILGTQTAGAGGYVMSESFPNLFGIAGFSYTGSIAERIDHNPIENLGITPDIKVELTERDLESNFEDLTSAINQAVEEL